MQYKILIALVYNNNGISTWSFEAARCLLQEGYDVRLAWQKPATIPDDLTRCAIEYTVKEARTPYIKVIDKFKWLMGFLGYTRFNVGPLQHCIAALEVERFKPDLILVNQTDFLAPGISPPQWVVARAWPTHLMGYLSKLKLDSSVSLINRLHDLLIWYKMDKKAYRNATGVMAITQQLATDLGRLGINAKCVYPCTARIKTEVKTVKKERLHFITAALDLEDKRKNISWMMDLFFELANYTQDWDLTLVGTCSHDFRNLLLKLVPKANFTGKLSRADLINKIGQADVFVFTSNQENWGYVLVEAMSQGLAVVAPNEYPFTEIIGRNDYYFHLKDRTASVETLKKIACHPELLMADKEWFYSRYCKSFSYTSFAGSVADILKCGTHER